MLAILSFFLISTAALAPNNGPVSWRYFPAQSNSPHCTCVWAHQCAKGNADFEVDGLLDPRIIFSHRACAPSQVCCNDSDILDDSKCGTRHSSAQSERIISPFQSTAQFADWPWHVAIVEFSHNQTIFVCSGVLIDSRHVLSAAHCFATRRHRNLYARLGEWNAQSTEEPLLHRDVPVWWVSVHPHFDRANLWNDIAVLKLMDATVFQENIQPICLPRAIVVLPFDCVVTGWGRASDTGHYSATLQETSMRVIDFEKCQAQLRQTRLGSRFRLHPSFICAGGIALSDSCMGDGGGPLACRGIDGLFYLTGLVSWGVKCGLDAVPGVYVNVARFVPWIEQIIRLRR